MKEVSKLAASVIIAASMISAPAFAKETALEFVTKAALATNFEIESSKLALDRSSNAEVKSFAKQMIDDHTAAAAKMKDAAAKDNIDTAKLPASLDDKDAKTLAKLKDAKPEKFDEAYMEAQESAHKKAIDLFEDFAGKGDTQNLKIFAAETLPKLKEHGKHADELESKVD
jgi:putative membrane protein